MDKRRILSVACLLGLLLCVLPVSARADMGPKPQITIHVVNAPDEPYYLDLLIPADEDAAYDNLNWNQLDPAALDETLIAGLRACAQDGWQLAMLDGTQAPMHGKLESTDDVFVFGYHGAPETFRIAIATASGGRASETARRGFLQEEYTYDYAANTIATAPGQSTAMAKQLCATFFPTLLLEGIVLLLFGFSLWENWKPFLLTNFGTQIILTLTLGALMLSGGTLFTYLLFWPVEIVVFVIEALVYRRYLTGGRGKKPHPVAYALTANLVSALAGFVSLRPLTAWIFPR